MDELREAVQRVRPSLEGIEFLAPADSQPEPVAQLDRLRRLFAARLETLDLRARPALVAVIGGTNVGKSTVFNLILGASVAQPAGTAAATRSAALSVERRWAEAFAPDDFLPWFEHRPWLAPELLNQPLTGATPRLYLHLRDQGPGVALADTPDIDSTHLANHRTTEDLFFVADAVLFVTSEQKYGDEACWRYLTAAERFGKAILVVFNRVEPSAESYRDLAENRLPEAAPRATLLTVPLLAETAPGTADDRVAPLREQVARLAQQGPELLAAARRGAANGFAVELLELLTRLEEEVTAVEAFRQRARAAAAAAAASYHPQSELDELDQAVLEALEELRVPGIDWVYEQLGLVRQRLVSGLRFVGVWLRGLGGSLKTVEELAAEQADREAELARIKLVQFAADLRAEAVRAPAAVRQALVDRLPELSDERDRDLAVSGYLTRLEARRRELVQEAKEQIVAQLREEGVKIRVVKGITRSATVAVSVAAMVTTGGVSAHDFAVAPVADAVTKWLLDRYLGQSWREKLQQQVTARRRQLLVDWLCETALEPLAERLPRSHRAGFLEEARAAAAAIQAAAR